MPHPETVVEVLATAGDRAWGRFADRPRIVRPADEFTGWQRGFQDWRTKEWVGFTLVHPELFGSMIVQEAKYLASSELYACDAVSGELHERHGSMRGGTVGIPADLLHGGRVRFADAKRGYRLDYDFDEERGHHSVFIDAAGTDAAPAITGELVLRTAGASGPLAVSTPLARGAAMFTYKRAFPASGTIRIGEREYDFDPSRDLAIIDEHRTHLPYRTEWMWGTFASTVDGAVVGANLCAREQLGAEEESCIWAGGAAEPLSHVAFIPTAEDPLAEWAVASADGRLEVMFTPLGRKGVRRNAVVAGIDYAQLYGTYRGVVRGDDGAIEIDGAHGVIEHMRMRS